MLKKLVLILFIIKCNDAFIFQTKAEDLPSLEDQIQMQIMPPAPSVSEIFKYAKFPVEHFSGKPKINIPLVNLKSKELSLNFSLGYNGGGVKVEQKSGIIGLGWALIGEPIISRTVKGLPDDLNDYYDVFSGFFYNRSLFYNNYDPDLYYPWIKANVIPWEVFCSLEPQSLNSTSDRLLAASKGLIDTEPDVFSFSIEDYHGEFYVIYDAADDLDDCECEDYCINTTLYDENFKVILHPWQDIIIDPTFDNTLKKITKFEVTLPNGHNYVFDVADYVEVHIVNLSNYTYNTAWRVSKIRNAQRTDSITVTYHSSTILEQDFTKSFRRHGGQAFLECGSACGNCEAT